MPAWKPGPIVVDASLLAPTGMTIDRIARQQLHARRLGRRILLWGVSDDLEWLIRFAGLGEVLRIEAGRKAEEGEQPLGAEKEGQLPDPPV
jgi:hypothetical protein